MLQTTIFGGISTIILYHFGFVKMLQKLKFQGPFSLWVALGKGLREMRDKNNL